MHHFFVGLGNPGLKYAMTRHNIGFMVLKEWGSSLKWDFREKSQFNAWVAKGECQGKTIHLLMPTTYMNNSGQAVRRYMDYANLVPHDLVVVVDDIALPFGELRLRSMGSAGGHNGLKSIEAHLGTRNYARLRMGIGHNGPDDLADYVLDSFDTDEKKALPGFISKGMEALRLLVDDNITQVMNKINTKPPLERPNMKT
jgi:peptidyl-tRNA hydrolase, PTH1 family